MPFYFFMSVNRMVIETSSEMTWTVSSVTHSLLCRLQQC